MAYRLIYGEFWTDPKVMEEMSAEDRYFYLYLLTNPSTTSCGVYAISKKVMAFHLGYSIEEVNVLVDRFENTYKLIKYNSETREIAIKNWGKHNLNKGGKPIIDCFKSELRKVKDKGLIVYVLENVKNPMFIEMYESFCDKLSGLSRTDSRYVDNTDTNTITDTSTYTERDTDTVKDINTNGTTAIDNFNNTKELPKEKNIVTEDLGNINSLSISLISEYEKLIEQVGVLDFTAIKFAVIKHGIDNVKKAINKALEKGKLTMAYVNGILKTWAREGYPKGEDCYGYGGSRKNTAKGTGEFSGFKPKEPSCLTDEEGRELEAILI